MLCLTFTLSCSKEKTVIDSDSYSKDTLTHTNSSPELGHTPPAITPPFICIDSANKMLNSYLNSITNTGATPDLKSLIVDADALRSYLEDTNIKHVKLMFAHRLDYINNGNGNGYAGVRYDGLTIIIAGYDNSNNYIYNESGAVLDNCQPCPYSCPSNGTASYHTLQ